MPGLVPGIHVFLAQRNQDVDGRDKPGHDGDDSYCFSPTRAFLASVASHTMRLPRSRPNSSIGS